MAQTLEQFYEDLLTEIGEAALRRVRPDIRSETLQDALRLEVSTSLRDPRAVLYIPHYWAVYVHDGRGPVVPRDKFWLVWFSNPADDPRTDYGQNYPVRVADVRRLTKDQWDYGIERNAEARRLGQPPYMIVTQHSGPVNFPKSFEFFSKGMSTFSSEAGPIAKKMFDRYVRSLVKSKTDSVTQRLG